VEGQSDENALSVALTEGFEQKYGVDTIVLFAKIQNDDGTRGGDITSRKGAVPDRLHLLMNKLIVMPCINEYSLMPKYVTEIVQIIDTDGAFIPDSKIKANGAAGAGDPPVYCDDCILVANPDSIIDRNARKRANIQTLLNFHANGFEIQNYCDTGLGNKPTTKPCRVPYSLYYFSCNLDHYIGKKANVDRFKKIACADDFARRYGNDLYSFAEYLKRDDAAVKDMTYEDSWALVMHDNNSLKRSTNIGLLINKMVDVSALKLDIAG
jgi:hypothetical protein